MTDAFKLNLFRFNKKGQLNYDIKNCNMNIWTLKNQDIKVLNYSVNVYTVNLKTVSKPSV